MGGGESHRVIWDAHAMRRSIVASGRRGSGNAAGDATACTTHRPSVAGVAGAARLSTGSGDGRDARSRFSAAW